MSFIHFRPSLFAVLVLAISCARKPYDEKTKSDLIGDAGKPYAEKTKSDLIGDAGKLEFLPTFRPANLEWQTEPVLQRDFLSCAAFRVANQEWQTEPAAREMEWETAKSYCASLSLAGGGWRLPSKDELLALYGAKTFSATLARYPGMLSHAYWTSSPGAGLPTYVWSVDFNSGYTGSFFMGTSYAVRCMR